MAGPASELQSRSAPASGPALSGSDPIPAPGPGVPDRFIPSRCRPPSRDSSSFPPHPALHAFSPDHHHPSTPSRPLTAPTPLTSPTSAPSRLPARPLRVAVLGATGAVGQELLALLDEREFPVAELLPLASPRSAGQAVDWKGEALLVQPVQPGCFAGVDLVLASAGGSVSRAWAAEAVAAGAVLIDNSSAFRLDPAVPLVVPEVNPEAVFQHRGIIANPNCTTILLTVALAPLAARRPIRRVVVSTYQSASGAGARAMEELRQLSRTVLEGGEPVSSVLPHSLAFNLFLHNSPLEASGYCEEELKMVNETRKIMDLPDLRLSATCVRVPVLRAHSEAVNIEFSEPFPVAEARALLERAAGVELIEDFSANRFPMPTDVTGRDPVAVGRIRQDLSEPNALELWLCGDQIRKGAALNAIQIAELLRQGGGV